MSYNSSKSGLELLLVVSVGIILFATQLYRITPDHEISEDHQKLLIEEASAALTTLDVPVGSLLLYDDVIIGKGHNTVKADSNLAGHAEINALNDAVHKMGLVKFNQLHRDRLVLLTTFEPCEMCRGTIEHYGIEKVVFLKNKSLLDWWKKQWNGLKYEYRKRQSPGEELQDSLFYLHPEYPGNQ